jgi:hypothetical protein
VLTIAGPLSYVKDFVLIGALYGYRPDTLAAIAELIPETAEPPDPGLEQFAQLLRRLPSEHQDELLALVLTLTQSPVLAFGEHGQDLPVDPSPSGDGSITPTRA